MEKSSINGALNGKIDYGGFPIAMIDYRKLQVDLGLYYNSVIYMIYIYIYMRYRQLYRGDTLW